jgi:hypothetical protein
MNGHATAICWGLFDDNVEEMNAKGIEKVESLQRYWNSR